MPHSPLLDQTAPAATIDLAGWTVADHYGDPAAEAAAVHQGAGLIDQSERGRLEVRGEQIGPWLNKVVSNDTARLAPGQWLRALLLTVKGRIACDLRAFALPERFLLETAFDTADGLRANLRTFILFGDRITLTDLRPGTVQFGVHGPSAAQAVRQATGLDVAGLAPHAVVEHDRLVAAHVGDFGEPGYLLMAPAERGPELWEALARHARPFGWQAAEALRVEAGLPRWGAELTGEVLPLEAELEEALSHTKGCYPGQEIVARMRDRGHANRLLRRLDLDGDAVPPRGATVSVAGDPKPVGQVTSAHRSPSGVRALAYLRVVQAEPGTMVEVQTPDGAVNATVRDRGRWP